MRAYHRRAPFLFFNGNTFADIARGLAALPFSELPPVRLKQVTSADLIALPESLVPEENPELKGV